MNSPLHVIAVFLFINMLAYCTNVYFELHPDGQDWMYSVHILQKYDDYNFRADVPDRHGVRHEFALTFCPDYKVTTEIQAGVTLTYLTYARDIHLHCYEVGKPGFGYGLERKNNVPIINAAFARQATP